MKALFSALFILCLLAGSAAAQRRDSCDVPGYLLFGESELSEVAKSVKERQQLDIAIIGSGSSTLGGPEGKAYPARLEVALKARLPQVNVTVTIHAAPRQTAADMREQIKQIVREQRPALIVWQTGTVDAIRSEEHTSELQSL